MKRPSFLKHFNWRIMLLRILINAGVLILIAAVLPDIYFVNHTLGDILLVGLVLGLLNAIVKPVIQFLTFSFIFATFGIVVILINALILMLLARIFPSIFVVSSLFWAFIGGALVGLFGSFLESLLGVSAPIIPEKYPELRQKIDLNARPLEATLIERHSRKIAEQKLENQASSSPALVETLPSISPPISSSPETPPVSTELAKPIPADADPQDVPATLPDPASNPETSPVENESLLSPASPPDINSVPNPPIFTTPDTVRDESES